MKPAARSSTDGPSVRQRVREAEEFFMKRDRVHTTLERLARRLDEEKIPYAIVGGMALSIHGYTRVTEDVDVLMTAAGLQKFEERCVGRGYGRAFPDARNPFRDTESNVPIEILSSGDYPGDGKPKRVSFPDPESAAVEVEGLRVIALEKLIELKLASGLSAGDRLRDLADVQDLIARLNLSRDLSERLDESVRVEYVRLWELLHERRREE
jgi:hypothetical protein